MKRLLQAYAGIGRSVDKATTHAQGPFIFEGAQPPIWQTPGRLQYYKAENEPWLPDEIKWGLRFPTKFAIREYTLNYEDKVQHEILAFLGKNIAVDYLDGSREVDLDLTLKEAEMLFNANDKIREMAANGELQAFHKRCSDTQSAVETGYTNVMDQLDRILKQISEMEDEVYDDMRETESLERLRSHERTSVIDIIALSGGNVALENYLIIKGLAETKDEGSQVIRVAAQLKELIGARAAAMTAKAQVQEELLRGVCTDDDAAQMELRDYKRAQDQFVAAYGEADENKHPDAQVFLSQIQQTAEGDMKTLLDNINDHERNQDERTKLYADYYEPKVDESVADAHEVFRGNLLKHLAGNIVVKEHRIRYQKEQFDRFLASTKYHNLKNNSQTLKEFAHNYASLIASMTDSSHHFKCPKIEANYDDFAKESILPLSPTIFYYYFSANRSGRTWAQWMLAAVRYPNSKTRRAYMRFFS